MLSFPMVRKRYWYLLILIEKFSLFFFLDYYSKYNPSDQSKNNSFKATQKRLTSTSLSNSNPPPPSLSQAHNVSCLTVECSFLSLKRCKSQSCLLSSWTPLLTYKCRLLNQHPTPVYHQYRWPSSLHPRRRVGALWALIWCSFSK